MTSFYAEERQGHHRIARFFPFSNAGEGERFSLDRLAAHAEGAENSRCFGSRVTRLISDSVRKRQESRGKRRNSCERRQHERDRGRSDVSVGRRPTDPPRRVSLSFIDSTTGKNTVSPYTISTADSPPVSVSSSERSGFFLENRPRLARGFPRFLRWSMTRGCLSQPLASAIVRRVHTHDTGLDATHTCTPLWHTRLPWTYMYRRYGHACNRERVVGRRRSLSTNPRFYLPRRLRVYVLHLPVAVYCER